jgi:hypothetical protein
MECPFGRFFFTRYFVLISNIDVYGKSRSIAKGEAPKMAMRKRNPSRLTYKDYLNDLDSYRITFEEWKKKNEWEDSDKCDHCGAWKGSAYICPDCRL